MPVKPNSTVSALSAMFEMSIRSGYEMRRYRLGYWWNASYLYECDSYASVDVGQSDTKLSCVLASTMAFLRISFVPMPCKIRMDTSTNC